MDLRCYETMSKETAGAGAVFEEIDKTAKEVQLFHEIKNYMILLNKEASLEQSKLYIIASAYECTLRASVLFFMLPKNGGSF